MLCPNCQAPIESGQKCIICGVDSVLFLGVMGLSDRLYNQGLERLRAFDFYHGIQYLTKSVAINKNNVPARNLLGLALFEVGHVGDALKHWVISHNLLKDANPAIKYINHVHESRRAIERFSDAVVMYNKALNHIRQASDDLAIIQLKKAIEINPKFVDAMNLLTLCHLIQNNKDRALSIIERVLAIDSQNAIALNYLGLLRPNLIGAPRLPKPTAPPPPPKPMVPQQIIPFKQIDIEPPKQKSFHFAEIIAFFLGAAGAAVIAYFLLIPMIEQEHDERILEVREEMAQAAVAHGNQMREAAAREEELETFISGLEGQITELEIHSDLLRRTIVVHDANGYFLGGYLSLAVSMLDGISLAGLPESSLEITEAIFDYAYPVLGSENYTYGLEAFNDADYALALGYLTNAHRFLAPRDADEYEEVEYPVQWNQLLFKLGRAHYMEGNFAEAYDFLVEVHERAPELQESEVVAMIERIEGMGVLGAVQEIEEEDGDED